MDTTLEDVVSRIILVQEMKLLHLQDVKKLNEEGDMLVMKCNKSMMRILEKYRSHYSRLEKEKDNNNIVIRELCGLSYLRIGLEKDTLKFIEMYFFLRII